jgi:uncharacterized protein (DUF885 family)
MRFEYVAATVLFALAPATAWAQPSSADAQLKAIYDAEWEWRQKEFAQIADGLRSKSDDHFPAFAPADRESLRGEVANIDFRTYEAPLNSDSYFWGEVKPYAPLENADDYRRYIGRLNDVPRWFDQNIANMRAGLKRGFTPPRVSLAGRDATIAAFTKPGADNPLAEPFKAMPASISASQQASLRAEGLAAIDTAAAPAYANLLVFYRGTYLPGTRTTVSASPLPDGESFYKSQILEYTTLDLTPEAIHQIGLKEVSRIDADMKTTIATTGFKGSFADFLAFLRSDPQFYARTPDELLGFSAYVAKRMNGQLKTGKLLRREGVTFSQANRR